MHETIVSLTSRSHISFNKMFLVEVPIKSFHNFIPIKKIIILCHNIFFFFFFKKTISPPQKTIIYLLINFLKNKIKLRIEFFFFEKEVED